MPRELAPRFRERFADTVALADALVVSCEEHLVKPMREIYDLTAARLGVDGSDICFFDDSADNCRGAEEAGWKAIRFGDVRKAREDFTHLPAETVG
jgi:HAD superfamily hydrolase (TIGR01509 family)